MPPPPYVPTPPPTAAAPESQSPLVGEGKPIKVLVTGFGPWDRHGINPSHEIVSRLPTSLTLSSGRKVELGIKTPLPVAYNFVHNHLPALLDEYQPDLVLHVGLAGGRKYYAPELSAPRNGFLYADIEGRTWSKEMGETAVPGQIPTPISTTKPPNHHGESDTPLWPKTLRTSLEYGTVVGKWKAKNEGLGIESRESDDVGGFMCGFSYYTSLAWFRSKSLVSAENQELEKDVAEGGPVLFLHVPETSKEEEWAKGRQVTINLIETMVEVWLRQK